MIRTREGQFATVVAAAITAYIIGIGLFAPDLFMLYVGLPVLVCSLFIILYVGARVTLEAI